MNNNEMPTNVAPSPEEIAKVEPMATSVEATPETSKAETTTINVETPQGVDASLSVPTMKDPAIIPKESKPKFVDPAYEQAKGDNWRNTGSK